MGNEKNVDKAVVKAVEKKAEVKKEILTIANVFKELATKGCKDRDTLANAIIKYLADKGVTKNVRGHTIVKGRVSQQISAMLRDIRMERGKASNSWWSKYTIVESTEKGKEGIKIVLKA